MVHSNIRLTLPKKPFTKGFLVSVILFFIGNPVFGQDYFDGIINYKIEYTVINDAIPVDYLETEMGTSFTAYIQEDRYAMIYHGTGEMGWSKNIVLLKEGYSYTEFENSDTIYKSKFGLGNEKLIEFKRNKDDKIEILGEVCESVTIDFEPNDPKSFYTKRKGKFYFNPRYRLNPELYENYTDGFWNLFVNESKSISIRNEIEYYPIYKVIQEANTIKQQKVSNDVFTLSKDKYIIEIN